MRSSSTPVGRAAAGLANLSRGGLHPGRRRRRQWSRAANANSANNANNASASANTSQAGSPQRPSINVPATVLARSTASAATSCPTGFRSRRRVGTYRGAGSQRRVRHATAYRPGRTGQRDGTMGLWEKRTARQDAKQWPTIRCSESPKKHALQGAAGAQKGRPVGASDWRGRLGGGHCINFRVSPPWCGAPCVSIGSESQRLRERLTGVPESPALGWLPGC